MRLIYFLIGFFVLLFTRVSIVSAHCPLCTAGAAGGLTLSRWLGVDDSITGIWIAAFLGASAFWLSNLIKKQFIAYQESFIYLGVFVLSIFSFYAVNLVNRHEGLIMGIPKLIFGIILGGFVFYIVEILNKAIKRKKKRVLFPYQPLVFSLASMLILSLLDYIFINYFY